MQRHISNEGKCKERYQLMRSVKCHFNSCKTQRTAVPKERQKVPVCYILRVTNITTFALSSNILTKDFKMCQCKTHEWYRRITRSCLPLESGGVLCFMPGTRCSVTQAWGTKGASLLQKNFNNGNCCDNNDDNEDEREHANKRTEFKDSSAAFQFPVSIKVCKAFI